ncbi:MAG: hypothetical protein WC758_06580 [Candidatus Woesearchaeota archaeon]|jgi:molecular chaperone GrpE (heat shock protein)
MSTTEHVMDACIIGFENAERALEKQANQTKKEFIEGQKQAYLDLIKQFEDTIEKTKIEKFKVKHSKYFWD